MLKKVVNFLFELGKLNYTPRSGWQYLGIRDPQSVAEHTARTAQIAFVLAILEGHKNPCHCATVALFHDITEARTIDMNRVSKEYNKTEHQSAHRDQIAGLGVVGDGIAFVWNEFEDEKTRASKIARDADVLEMMLTAKELMSIGYSAAQEWIDSGLPRLETNHGKRIGEEILTADPNEWWKGFKTRVDFSSFVV